MEYHSSNPFGYRQSGNWRNYMDGRGWRFQPPYVPPKRAPIKQLSVRHPSGGGGNYNKSIKGPKYLEVNPNTGEVEPQRVRKGSSLPGYKPPTVEYGNNLSISKAAWRAAGFLGHAIPKINPYIRALDMAFQIAYAFNDDAEWAKQGEETPNEAALRYGWTVCCDGGYSGGQKLVYSKYSYFTSQKSGPATVCGRHLGCGTSLQVPQGEVSSDTFTVPERRNTTGIPYVQDIVVHTGMGDSRFRYERKYGYRRVIPGRTTAPEVKIEPASRIMPMPIAINPTPSAIVEDVYAPSDRVKRRRRIKQYQRPAVNVVVAPGSGGHIPPRTGNHNVVRPAPGEREKKTGVGLRRALGVLSRIYDATTEAQDLVDALLDAIPGSRAAKKLGLHEKVNYIYDNIDRLDMAKAVGNIIANEAEDRAVGAFHGALKKARAPFGSSMFGGYVPNVTVR